MKPEIESFAEYLRDVKKISKNTEISYRRDLMQLAAFLEERGIVEVEKVTRTSLNSYFLYLEKEGKAASTISRELASIKGFFHFMYGEKRIHRDPAELLRAPKIEKRIPVILSVSQVSALLEQPGGASPKEIRDKAMRALLYATGMRVSELTGLRVEDLNMKIGYITCRDERRERMIPFGAAARSAMERYLSEARARLLKNQESPWLFVNCSGGEMSRQGFWKIIKYYGQKAGIKEDITPHTLRHSFAAHLIRSGTDAHAVQAMLGHLDSSAVQMYASYCPEKQ